MILQTPQALLLLFFLPLYWGLKRAHIIEDISLALPIYDWQEDYSKPLYKESTVIRGLRYIVDALMVMSVVMVIVALSGPTLLHTTRILDTKGLEVIFALDTSSSMSIKDIPLNKDTGDTEVLSRIEAAKIAIKSLTEGTTGGKYALLVFASKTAMILPLTEDKDALDRRLESIEIGKMGLGSAIGEGLSMAAYHLDPNNNPSGAIRCVVVLTDGENNAGAIHPDTSALLLSQLGIRLYALGIGRADNGVAPFEYTDNITGRLVTGYAKTNFDDKPLMNMCRAGKGQYYRVQDIKELSGTLLTLSQEATSGVYKTITTRTIMSTRLFMIASICLMLAWLLKYLVLGDMD